jgi:hypothetical protein
VGTWAWLQASVGQNHDESTKYDSGSKNGIGQGKGKGKAKSNKRSCKKSQKVMFTYLTPHSETYFTIIIKDIPKPAIGFTSRWDTPGVPSPIRITMPVKINKKKREAFIHYYHNFKGRPIWEFALEQGNNGSSIVLKTVNSKPTLVFSKYHVCQSQIDRLNIDKTPPTIQLELSIDYARALQNTFEQLRIARSINTIQRNWQSGSNEWKSGSRDVIHWAYNKKGVIEPAGLAKV